MKEIKKIIEMIDEELDGAEHYACLALKKKEEGATNKSKTFLLIANEELNHANLLHEMAVNDINETRSMMTVDVPEYMQETWNEEHSEYIEHVAKIKYMIEMYRA